MKGRGPSTRILVVEDSPTQAKKLQAVLESGGYTAQVARDGQQGLDAFSSSPFDLVLSDVVMPVLCGYDLCRRIKAHPRGKDVPVLLLTSLSKPIDMIRGLECGADNFINKPYEPEHLLDRIRALLANRGRRIEANPDGAVEIAFMGERFTIATGKAQALDFLGATFEEFVRAKQREYEIVFSAQKQSLEAEARRAREDLLIRERETLLRSQQFLQATLDALSVQIAILDDSGTIISVNRAWDRNAAGNPLGRADRGQNYLETCRTAAGEGVEDASSIASGVGAVIDRSREEFFLEFAGQGPQGKRWFSVRTTRFDHSGRARVVVAHEDITQRKTAEERLQHDAFHDALTGLPNRALFMERLRRAILRTARQKDYGFAVLFLDVDGFKYVNDSLGHATGDHLLIAFGRRLEANLRQDDTLARLGGDEFAILAENLVEVGDAIQLAERLQASLRDPFHVGRLEVFATASIGIALGGKGSDLPEDLLRDADTAMYRAKVAGKGIHVVFDTAMHTSVVKRLKLETDLRRALERQELRVHYQAIVSLRTGRVAGFEALARWEHPECGSISPAEFIPIAEETGLILPLGLWVLHQACRQLREWRDSAPKKTPLMISVNLSGRQLAQPDLVEEIDRIVRRTGIDPHDLMLEITESELMEHSQSAAEVLQRLRALGLRLSLDDFGTGYSSLSYLHQFPLDTLKIDRSFVSRLDDENRDTTIVQTIIGLARNLHLQVVAEGVETKRQVALLKAMGCQYGQGFYFSRPLDAEDAAALLRGGSLIPSLSPF